MLLDLRPLITTTLVNSVFKDDISCLELGIQTSSKFLCKVLRDHTHEDQKKFVSIQEVTKGLTMKIHDALFFLPIFPTERVIIRYFHFTPSFQI